MILAPLRRVSMAVGQRSTAAAKHARGRARAGLIKRYFLDARRPAKFGEWDLSRTISPAC
jgi:hypothetical protein